MDGSHRWFHHPPGVSGAMATESLRMCVLSMSPLLVLLSHRSSWCPLLNAARHLVSWCGKNEKKILTKSTVRYIITEIKQNGCLET